MARFSRSRLVLSLATATVLLQLASVPTARGVTTVTGAEDLSVPLPDPSAPPPGGALVQTPTLRSRTPSVASGTADILIIGTGVRRSLFPAALQSSINYFPGGDTDTHGYGTLAASVIFQLLGNATVTSRLVPAWDTTTWSSLNLTKLAEALEALLATPEADDLYDVVLLAFPPASAIDPLPYLSTVHYNDQIGSALAMMEEAILQNLAKTNPPVGGIPLDDDALRAQVFAGANLKHLDAVEKFVTRFREWQRVSKALSDLAGRGVAVVAPAGDFPLKKNNSTIPVYPQSIFGVSASPNVITVGATYQDATTTPPTTRLVSASGTGPTLGLRPKPDLVAPTDVLGLLPTSSLLGKVWGAKSGSLDWASVADTVCSTLATDPGHCVLQGTSMVAAAAAAANIGALVQAGTPNASASRAQSDEEVLLSLAQAKASAEHATAYGGSRLAYSWEEGAGVLRGLCLPDGFGTCVLDPTTIPVPIGRPDLGEIATCATGKSLTLSLWSGGAVPATAQAALDSFLGAALSGASTAASFPDPGDRVALDTVARTVTVSVVADADGDTVADHYQGGYYAGRLTLTVGPASYSFPMDVVRDTCPVFHADYAYNEQQTSSLGAIEGERMRDETVALLPAVPQKSQLLSAGFRYLAEYAVNPADKIIRFAVTKGGEMSGRLQETVLPDKHGTATINGVPPGFWRYALISDYSLDAVQARGAEEGLGVMASGSGPEVFTVPGATLLLSSVQACAQAETALGPPTSPSCVSQGKFLNEKDPATGFCKVSGLDGRNYWLYCGEAAIDSAVTVASRAIHLVEYDQDPLKTEWKACAVDVPLDGTKVDLDAIVNRATGPLCPAGSTATLWQHHSGAPDCLGPAEKAAYPGGYPTDVTATYSYAGQPPTAGTANLPVDVLTYTFALPTPNLYTEIAVSFSYKVENAILAVRVLTGYDRVGDAVKGMVLAGDPKLTVDPALTSVSFTGSAYRKWSLLTAGATTASVSFILTPTTWVSGASGSNLAKVQLCDTGIKAATFAKQSLGTAGVDTKSPAQKFSQNANGLLSQINPTDSRMRPRYNTATGTFQDLGTEREDALFAVHVPKHTTMDATKLHHVVAPRGGPAYLLDVRGAAGTSLGSGPFAGFPAYDPLRGSKELTCNESDQVTGALCQQWNSAVKLLGLANMWINGEFFGTLPLGTSTLNSAGGVVTWVVHDGDDSGASESQWTKDAQGALVKAFQLTNFYGGLPSDALATPQIPVESAWIQVATSQQNGRTILTLGVKLPIVAGEHTISTDLNCVTVDGTVKCA